MTQRRDSLENCLNRSAAIWHTNEVVYHRYFYKTKKIQRFRFYGDFNSSKNSLSLSLSAHAQTPANLSTNGSPLRDRMWRESEKEFFPEKFPQLPAKFSKTGMNHHRARRRQRRRDATRAAHYREGMNPSLRFHHDPLALFRSTSFPEWSPPNEVTRPRESAVICPTLRLL